MAVRLRRGLLDKVRAAGENSRLDEAAIAERVAALEKLLAGADLTGLSLALLDENIFARALQAIEKQFADQPLVKADLLQTVANVLCDLGLLDGAMAPQTEALAIRRAQLGNDHPDTLSSIGDMGYLLHEQGKLAEAEPYCREALEVSRRVLGNEHRDTLISINNMGMLLQGQGKLAEAERLRRDGSNRGPSSRCNLPRSRGYKRDTWSLGKLKGL